MEKLPAIIESSASIFGAVAAPLGNIDKVVVIDQGNGAPDGGSSGITRLARTGPSVVFNLLQQLEALGLNLPAVMQQLGLPQANGGAAAASPATSAESEAPAKREKSKA